MPLSLAKLSLKSPQSSKLRLRRELRELWVSAFSIAFATPGVMKNQMNQ
jgi:hypothetical protein